MVTKIQRQREELSDKIVILEQRYRDTSANQRVMDFIGGALEEWVAYKHKLEEFYGGKSGIQISKHGRFLFQVKDDFCRGMDELIQEYETHPHKNADYVKQTLDSSTRYLRLYIQSGLHKVSKEEEKRHVTYGKFIERLRSDLGSLISPSENPPSKSSLGSPRRHNNNDYKPVYDGIIQIHGEVGIATPFHLLLVTDGKGDVYWGTLRNEGVHSPDDTYFPVGKKLKDLTSDDIAMVLARAYTRENKMRGIVMPYEPEVLAIEIPTIAPSLVNQIFESVKSSK